MMSTATQALKERSHELRANAGTRLYRPELDALRFFAFLCVFASHILPSKAVFLRLHIPGFEVLQSIFSCGMYGVPLFFLLSAFLITSLLLLERNATGDVNLSAFYIRRILRIWPLYFLVIGIAAFFGLPRIYILGYSLLIGNWVIIRYGWPVSFAVALWSISIEEQFYLLWPCFAKWCSRKSLLSTAAVLVLTANVARIVLRHVPDTQLWPNTLAHLDSLGFGILCALLLQGPPIVRLPWRAFAFASGSALWIAANHYRLIESPLYALFGYPLISVGAMLIFFAFYGARCDRPLLSYLGKISYGLYIWHAPVITVLIDKVDAHTTIRSILLQRVLALAVSIGLAALSYRLVESPFLKLKRRFTVIASRPV